MWRRKGLIRPEEEEEKEEEEIKKKKKKNHIHKKVQLIIQLT